MIAVFGVRLVVRRTSNAAMVAWFSGESSWSGLKLSRASNSRGKARLLQAPSARRTVTRTTTSMIVTVPVVRVRSRTTVNKVRARIAGGSASHACRNPPASNKSPKVNEHAER
jgi:hypothetical protein